MTEKHRPTCNDPEGVGRAVGPRRSKQRLQHGCSLAASPLASFSLPLE